MSEFENELSQRVLVLDGAMGVMLQNLQLGEGDFRGRRFISHTVPLRGDNDVLNISRPEAVRKVHRAYIEAGADIITTNTFNSNSISQREYGLENMVAELNTAGARIARAEVDAAMAADGRRRFVAGSIGPTGMAASLPIDANDPQVRAVTFAELRQAFARQAAALIHGGVDLLICETSFDVLNVKAAIAGIEDAFASTGQRLPLIISATVSEVSGRLLSGHSIEAFLAAVAHARPAAVGLNCSAGPDLMLPHVRRLAEASPFPTIVYPNAGLPDELGHYDATPAKFTAVMSTMLDERLLNIAGGCCGTTPEHIRVLADAVSANSTPRVATATETAWLTATEAFSDNTGFINVGERCNVAGSRKFLRLVSEGQWEEAVAIARKQVRDGAMVLDINMDDAMLDSAATMTRFVRLLGADPLTTSVPWMIDSSDFAVIESALQNIAGKAIVNSISLKHGEEEFLRQALTIKQYGAAVVVMAFDEQGQATTLERRTEICSRAYHLLVDKAGYRPRDIIFDPNVLTIATGIAEHNAYGLDFIRAVQWIKANLPGAKTSGGVSNLSFAFRGNNYIRQAMHAVFLYHAIGAGLDMAIMDPGSKVAYSDIHAELLEVLEDVVLNRTANAAERLIELAGAYASAATTHTEVQTSEPEHTTPAQRLMKALRTGDDATLAADIDEALTTTDANSIVEGPLMDGMAEVGKLFETGRMFLPQVIKSAHIMHKAIELLRPRLEARALAGARKGTFMLATVKGDVHDIGKNIAAVVVRCNNFEVIDLGVQVEASRIVAEALRLKPDFIGLSGLIAPSLREMVTTVTALREAGVSVPVFIGGAATSELHTAMFIAPAYAPGAVVRVADASQNPVWAAAFIKDAEAALEANSQRQLKLRKEHLAGKSAQVAQTPTRPQVDWSTATPTAPSFTGTKVLEPISVHAVVPFINWTYFFNTWKVKPDSDEARALKAEALKVLAHLADEGADMLAEVGLFSAYSADNDIVHISTGDSEVEIPMPRQKPTAERAECLSLADFIAPRGHNDHIGAFIVTVGEKIRNHLTHTASEALNGDHFSHILMQSVADRLAEATSEYLHYRVRTELWGYAADEPLDMDAIRRAKYRGIRPAVGYPSLPDQLLMHKLAALLDPVAIGVTVTENGALWPQASVAGFYIASAHSRYFTV